jgi:hypothetical protein
MKTNNAQLSHTKESTQAKPSPAASMQERLHYYKYQADAPADALAAWIQNNPRQGWPQVEQALRQGVHSVTDASAELREFFQTVEAVPDWVDQVQLERACQSIWRSKLAALLGAYASMLATYEFAEDVMALYGTGEQTGNTEARSLRTVKWFLQATTPGGMKPGQPGWQATVRVRLIHGFARSYLRKSGTWNREEWGEPINLEAIAIGAAYVFSYVFIEAANQCGIQYTEAEQEDIYAFWRYIGYLQGAGDDLLLQNKAAALEQIAIRKASGAPPNEYSRLLTKAFTEQSGSLDRVLLAVLPPDFLARLANTQELEGNAAVKAVLTDFKYGMARCFAGGEMADQLGIPNTPWKHALGLIKPLIALRDQAGQLWNQLRGQNPAQTSQGITNTIQSILEEVDAVLRPDSAPRAARRG